jgi:hypothetical protein
MMNSATSIDGVTAEARASGGTRASGGDTFKTWHFFVLVSLLAATAAVILTRQSRPEHLVLISLIIGAAGFAAGTLYRTLAPLVGAKPEPDAAPLTESLRAVLEREKALVLRSIKELEFDRAMGKLSARDFDEMAGRLRARAMTLMRQLDAGTGYRELIEKELKARVRTRPGQAARAVASSGPAASAAVTAARCACGTANDPDARFCKACGAKLTLS